MTSRYVYRNVLYLSIVCLLLLTSITVMAMQDSSSVDIRVVHKYKGFTVFEIGKLVVVQVDVSKYVRNNFIARLGRFTFVNGSSWYYDVLFAYYKLIADYDAEGGILVISPLGSVGSKGEKLHGKFAKLFNELIDLGIRINAAKVVPKRSSDGTHYVIMVLAYNDSKLVQSREGILYLAKKLDPLLREYDIERLLIVVLPYPSSVDVMKCFDAQKKLFRYLDENAMDAFVLNNIGYVALSFEPLVNALRISFSTVYMKRVGMDAKGVVKVLGRIYDYLGVINNTCMVLLMFGDFDPWSIDYNEATLILRIPMSEYMKTTKLSNNDVPTDNDIQLATAMGIALLVSIPIALFVVAVKRFSK